MLSIDVIIIMPKKKLLPLQGEIFCQYKIKFINHTELKRKSCNLKVC